MIVLALIFISTVLTTIGNGERVECPNFESRKIVHVFNDTINFCVGFREGCLPKSVEGLVAYDDVQACVDENILPHVRRHLWLGCGEIGGVLTDNAGFPLFTLSGSWCRKQFCPKDSFCMEKVGEYGFCCSPKLPPGILNITFVSQANVEDEESPCLSNKLRYYFDADTGRCLAFREKCDFIEPSYDTVEGCARSEEYLAHMKGRLRTLTYWCPKGHTPQIASFLDKGTLIKYVIESKSQCELKQFCDKESICYMWGEKISYCCVKGEPEFLKLQFRALSKK